MSNEYLDWMREGGACIDCIYNIFKGSDAACAMDRPEHKKERYEWFEEERQ